MLLPRAGDHPRVGREKQTGTVYAVLPYGSPRAGGEKLMGRPRRSVGAGSPPRGRGKEIHFRETVSCHGITPAWAGKSKYTLGTVESAWDHPRVGGEKVTTGMTLIGNGGSPPRGRGKARLRVVQVPTKRITPAWAGKSCAPLTGHITGRDHPRVGGEKQDCE